MFDYPAKIIAIVDADTIDIRRDAGCDVFQEMRIRFSKINAPEKATPEGKVAIQWLTSQLKNSDGSFKELVVLTEKDKKEKYGRYLGEIWIKGEDYSKVASINVRMVESGNAIFKDY